MFGKFFGEPTNDNQAVKPNTPPTTTPPNGASGGGGGEPEKPDAAIVQELHDLRAVVATLKEQLEEKAAQTVVEPPKPNFNLEDLDLANPEDVDKLVQWKVQLALHNMQPQLLSEVEKKVGQTGTQLQQAEERRRAFFEANPDLKSHDDYVRFVAGQMDPRGYTSQAAFLEAVAARARKQLNLTKPSGTPPPPTNGRGPMAGGDQGDDGDPQMAKKRKLGELASVRATLGRTLF